MQRNVRTGEIRQDEFPLIRTAITNFCNCHLRRFTRTGNPLWATSGTPGTDIRPNCGTVRGLRNILQLMSKG